MLTADLIINETGTGNVNFNSTVNDDGAGGTSSNLTVNVTGGGNANFIADVGGTDVITSLTTNATTTNLQSVTTSNSQSYTGSVRTASTATLTTGNDGSSGTITFSGAGEVSNATGVTNAAKRITTETTGFIFNKGTVGNGNVFLLSQNTNSTTTTIQGSVADILNLRSYKAVTDSGNLDIGEATIRGLDATSTLVDVTLDNNNDFDRIIVSGKDVIINDINAIQFDRNNVATNLATTAGGDITQATGSTITSSDLSIFNAGANNIILDGSNDFTNLVITQAQDVTINDVTAGFNFGDTAGTTNSFLTGDLTVTANGSITDTSNLIASSGTTSINVGNANDITLNNNNDFNNITVLGQNVTLVDINAINFAGNSTVTNLTLTTNGNITDSSSITSSGLSSFNAGGNDIILDGDHDFTNVFINNAQNVTINENDATQTNGINFTGLTTTGTFNLTSNGNVTDSGTINIGGSSVTITATGQTVTLDDTSNDFGSDRIFIQAQNATLVDTNRIRIGDSTITDNFNISSGRNISFRGTVTSTNLTANSGEEIVDDNTPQLIISGLTTLDSGTDNITLDGNHDFNNILISNAGNVTLNEADGVNNNGINFTSINATGNFNLTSNGAVTDSGTIIIAGTSNINATGQTVTLDTSTNDFGGAVTVTAENTTLRDTNDIELGNLNISGNLRVGATGNITQSTGSAITQTGLGSTATLFGTDITLEEGNTLGDLTVTGSAVSIREIDAITQSGAWSASNLTLDSTGEITLDTFVNSISALGNILRGGAFSLLSNTNLTINGTVAGTAVNNPITIATTGILTLAGSASLKTTGANNVTLAGNTGFFNNASDPLDIIDGLGFWRIYAPDIDGTANTNLGGLISNGTQYNTVFPTPVDPAQVIRGTSNAQADGFGDRLNVLLVQTSPPLIPDPPPPPPPPAPPSPPTAPDPPLDSPTLNLGDTIGPFNTLNDSAISGDPIVAEAPVMVELSEGNIRDLSEEEVLQLLTEDISEEARQELLDALLTMLQGDKDPREELIPLGMALVVDSEGNTVLLNTDVLLQLLQSSLTDNLKNDMMEALNIGNSSE